MPDYGTLPEWAFIDHTGAPIGSETLEGRAWVANFIFTTCRSACPRIAAETEKLQARLRQWIPKEGPSPVRLVSITVDPVTDTPERLADFAQVFGADPRIWSFARGEYEAMASLVTGGFYQALERSDLDGGRDRAEVIQEPTPIDTAHSVHFVLVDRRGHIRGFYDLGEDSIARLDVALRCLSGTSCPAGS